MHRKARASTDGWETSWFYSSTKEMAINIYIQLYCQHQSLMLGIIFIEQIFAHCMVYVSFTGFCKGKLGQFT